MCSEEENSDNAKRSILATAIILLCLDNKIHIED